MSYRSLQRVLGETNLERKCRFLFGMAMAVLVGVTFWGVGSVAVNLVKNETRRKGRDWADFIMLRLHWDKWETTKNKIKLSDGKESKPTNSDFKILQDAALRDLTTQSFEHSILGLNGPERIEFKETVHLPADPEEERILKSLKARLDEQLAAYEAKEEAKRKAKLNKPTLDEPLTSPPLVKTPGQEATAAENAESELLDPIYYERERPELGEYHYYQPVYYAKQSCISCHSAMEGHAFSAAEIPEKWKPPFRVVKVIMPYKDTQVAITRSSAILWSVAIALVALSMLALYLIVKYVIVKPLHHLRDISENISRGDTSLRADIHTNDEFQELAESFNKMLRSLTDQESQLRSMNLTLDGKVDQLAQLNVRLYEMNRVKSDFLANMSHELRTPLNSIIGFSEVLQGVDSLTEKQKRYAQNIQKSGRLLLEMINDILDLAKMEAGRMEVRPTEFRIDTIVHAQCDMVRSLVEEKNLELVSNVPPDLPPLFQDQAKVQQILTNLLSNAIKFTPDGGRIVVSAGPNERQQFELTVTDTGVGIAEQDREIIFEKFRQGTTITKDDGLTREYSGTGLGLSIVRELCKLLGGEITFDSELGKGSTFRVVLPWVITQLPRPESPITARIDDLTKPRRADYDRRETIGTH